jgi:predicted RNA binding protein YcfA (HicA-like mRNA interferase family)
MGELAGVPHLKVILAFERAGFSIKRQGKHIIMSNGERIIIIPRNNPVKSFTLVGIVRNAGLTVEQFRDLL